MERLAAVGRLIEKIRQAGIAEPIHGPELRSLNEIIERADRDEARVIALGPAGLFDVPEIEEQKP